MKLSSDPKQHEIEALLPAYVLGALHADEMHSVESYILQQQNFLAQVQKFEERSALLTHELAGAGDHELSDMTAGNGYRRRCGTQLDPIAVADGRPSRLNRHVDLPK